MSSNGALHCLPTVYVLLFSLLIAAEAAWADGSVRVVPTPGGGQAVAARCDEQGVIHLVCSTQAGPQYVKSTDSGKSFSEPLASRRSSSRSRSRALSVLNS